MIILTLFKITTIIVNNYDNIHDDNNYQYS